MIKNKYPYFLLVLANVFWGGNFVVGRIAKDFYPPFTFSFIRWSIAFLILTPFLYKKLVRDKKILLEHKWVILFFGFSGVACYNTILYFALHYTTSINAAVINPVTPIFIALLSIFILKDKISAAQIVGIIISVIGVLFTISKGSLENITSFSFNKGDLLVLLAVFCWSIYSIYLKKYSAILPTYTTFYASILVAIILLAPFSLIEMINSSVPIVLNTSSIAILLYVGVFASIVAFLSWNIGVGKVGPTKAGIYLNLLPVFSAIFAPILTNEMINLYQLIGGVIVIFGVLISSGTFSKKVKSVKQLQS